MPDTTPVISAKNLNLWYGDFKALKNISLDVGEREITALIGPSGCGKSTFLKTLNRMNDLVPGIRIEAVDRLRDILNENGYSNVKRLAPPYKDWNEVLKAKNGVYALPAVPNKHKEEYHCQAENLQYLKCRPDKLTSQIYAAFKNEQYKYLAEYALALYH